MNHFDMSITAKRLKERRKELNLIQSEVAERAKITPQALSTYENGSIPRMDILWPLADALECEPDYLLGRIEHPKRTTSEISELIPLSREAIESLEMLGHEIKEYSDYDSALSLCVLDDIIINVVNSITVPDILKNPLDMSEFEDGYKYDNCEVHIVKDGLFNDVTDLLLAYESVFDFQSDNPKRKHNPMEHKYAKLAVRGIKTSIGDRLSDIIDETVKRIAER